MPKKRLVVCCDGTWNNADSSQDFTNVVRIARAIRADAAVPQIVYYHSGVGTGGDLFDKFGGGALGLGLSRNVRDAYAFLANNYCDGDEISLFGFSRGAYTARSVGGLIGWAGLLHKGDMDDFTLLWEGYRRRHQPGQRDVRLDFPDRHDIVPIKCIGVWDTVGALGIPGHLDDPVARFFQFHNTDLGVRVENAFHALAIDEHREDFIPTLWTKDPQAPNTQKVEQVWFAGAHANIGGGYEEHGLSDISLAWMADRVAPFLDLDPGYLETRQDRRDAWAMGRIYNSATGLFGLRDKVDRPVEASLAAGAKIHESVAVRFTGPMAEAYDPPALHGGPNPDAVIGLGAMEQRLRWPAADPAHLGRVRSAEPGFFDRLLRNFVIG